MELARLAGPASVGRFACGCCDAGALLGGGGWGGDFEVFCAADGAADQAVGGDDSEPDTGDDRDLGLLGALV
jgi:hypothetical protein